MPPSNASNFFKFTTTRPVAILMVVLGICVFGWISYAQLPVNLMPDISYPSLTVRTEYPGTAPEEVETTISRPVEQALGVVSNLVSISSISKAGQSDVKLEFTWDTEMNQASADVREMLDQVFLPDDANRPLILRFDPTLDPIMRFGLYGDASLIYLRYLAEEEIKRALETVEGVAAVKVKGGLEEEIRVELNEQQLTLIGIDIQEVRQRLQQENVNLAGGNLKEGQTEYLVRTLNEFKTVEEVAEVVIGNWNGREIKVGDVARVSRTFKDREIITRISNAESVEIEIFKEADANIVAVAERVRDKVFGSQAQRAFVKKEKEGGEKKEPEEEKPDEKAGAQKGKDARKNQRRAASQQAMLAKQMTNFITYSLPSEVGIDLLSDQSVFIQNSVDEVRNTALIGGLLAVLILFIFLRKLAATVIVGISIPISIVATFAPMKIFDVSLNIMSLGGLALGIGMLVDNSIVVLESIARCREEGDDLLQATVRGVGEVGGAVFASTLTTVAVFFPIVFVEGVAGQIFGNMALTVVFSLCASLGVALFLIPMLFSRQSKTFVQGAQIGQLAKQSVLHFQTQNEVDVLVSNSKLARSASFKKAVLLLGRTGGLILFKIGLGLGALVLAIAKHLTLFLAVLLSPVSGLLRMSGLYNFQISNWLEEFSAQQHLWKLSFFNELWPTFLVANYGQIVVQDFRRTKAISADSSKSILHKVGKILAVPFFLIRFIALVFLRLLFSAAHVVLMLVAVLLKGVFIMLRIILTSPARVLLSSFDWLYSRVERAYPPLLQKALEKPQAVLGGVTLILLLSLFVLAPRLGSELIPEVHQGEFNIEVTLPVGTPVETTDLKIAEIQRLIQKQPGIKKVASVSGTDITANSNSEEGEHTGKITVTLNRKGDKREISGQASRNGQSGDKTFAAVRADIAPGTGVSLPSDQPQQESPQQSDAEVVSEEELIAAIRRDLRTLSGVRWKISRPVLFSFKTPIEVEIHGYNLRELQQYSRELEERMAEIPGVTDIKSNMQRGNPEVQIVYDRALLAQYGLNIRDVASIVRNKVRGDVATEFKEQDRKIDVLVRLREKDRESIQDLRRLIVNPGAEKAIPLEAVAQIKVKEGPAEIRRVEQERTATVTANLSGRSLSSVSEDLFRELQAMDLPDDFTFRLAGQNEEMETSLNSLKLALALAIFLVYIVMASQFESMIHPFIIIFTIPLALIGVILYLFAFNIPLSIVVFLGMIMLAGIVVNNAIVLVDYINKLRDRGVEKMDAIVQAGKVRLRPIMMTTATTVLGLLPMALGLGDGAEIRTPMAITVIVGLASSTVLTLIIIPTVYSLVDRRK